MRLDFYGVTISLEAEPPLLEDLRRDFEYFVAPTSGGPTDISWVFNQGAPPAGERPSGPGGLRLRDCRVFDSGAIRRIVYGGRGAAALAVYDYATRQGRLYCEDYGLLHELAYLAILSRSGEELDLRGYHRLHALGFGFGSDGGLLLLPSGGGKSVLALELLRRTEAAIVSEDTPLIGRDLKLLAFPLRLGFAPGADLRGVPETMIRPFDRRRHGAKRLVDLDFFRTRIRSGLTARWLLIGLRTAGAPVIEPLSAPAAFPHLAASLIVGVGVAQIAEYMLRLTPVGLWNLARIGRARAAVAWRLLATSGCHRFALGPDPQANATALAEFCRR